MVSYSSDQTQRLCVHCEQPVVYWGLYNEWRHVGGVRLCAPSVATPGRTAQGWKGWKVEVPLSSVIEREES